MKSKASLVLMEQLVMILVFALSAALCLSLFARADGLSRETALQDRAVVLAQNGAETIKACRGDLEEAARYLEGEVSDGTLTAQHDDLYLEITSLPGEIPGLGTGEVTVYEAGTEQVLFTLTAAWQEVG